VRARLLRLRQTLKVGLAAQGGGIRVTILLPCRGRLSCSRGVRQEDLALLARPGTGNQSLSLSISLALSLSLSLSLSHSLSLALSLSLLIYLPTAIEGNSALSPSLSLSLSLALFLSISLSLLIYLRQQ